VLEAARIAHAHDFISALPNGYQTQVGENGAFLSGGQKQRIAIARAVVKDAPILLLDEATSALDTHSETAVREALDLASRGRTTVLVAHRLSTVLGADKVVYIDGGEAVEQGTVQGLLNSNGKFAALYRAQMVEQLVA
jgi:ATP-binding cassette subfamily B protein